MRAYQMQGTPTLLLFDKNGHLRKQKFGREQDLVLGAEIMALLKEQGQFSDINTDTTEQSPTISEKCDANGCAV